MNRKQRLLKNYTKSITAQDMKSYHDWYTVVKRELLKTEPQNILARAKCFTDIINQSVGIIVKELKLQKIPNNLLYSCDINPLTHLKFLISWPGLRIENTDRVPKTLKEYEKKSKNWLNGRRAPNYGKTLFPWFIFESEKYAVKLSKILIPKDDKKRGLFCDIIVYKVLSKLCGCSVSLHEQAKKAPFFCKNSVERKCKLRSLLQDYAKEHKYVQGFPSCFEEAVGYFDKKLYQLIKTYHSIYTNKSNNNNDNNNCDNKDDLLVPPLTDSTTEETINEDSDILFLNNDNSINETRDDYENEIEYWKKQLKIMVDRLKKEELLRIKAEKERDCLQRKLNRQNQKLKTEVNLNQYPTLGTPNLNIPALQKTITTNNTNCNTNNNNNNNNNVYGNHRKMISPDHFGCSKESRYSPIKDITKINDRNSNFDEKYGLPKQWVSNDYINYTNNNNNNNNNINFDQFKFGFIRSNDNTHTIHNLPTINNGYTQISLPTITLQNTFGIDNDTSTTITNTRHNNINNNNNYNNNNFLDFNFGNTISQPFIYDPFKINEPKKILNNHIPNQMDYLDIVSRSSMNDY